MSVTSIHLVNKKDLEPIVRHLENLAVAFDISEDKWKYYRVLFIEPIFVKIVTGTIPAGGSLDVDPSQIELGRNELGQVRILVMTDGFEAEVYLPESISKFITRNTKSRIDYWISSNYPHLTELFYFGDKKPRLTVYNTTATDGSAEIRIIGFRYILRELEEKPREYTLVYVTAVPPTRM